MWLFELVLLLNWCYHYKSVNCNIIFDAVNYCEKQKERDFKLVVQIIIIGNIIIIQLMLSLK